MSRRPAPPSVTALVMGLAVACLGCGLFAGPVGEGREDRGNDRPAAERSTPPGATDGRAPVRESEDAASPREGGADADGAEVRGTASAAWVRDGLVGERGAGAAQPE